MESFSDIFKALWDVWKEMLGAFFEVIPKVLKFTVWVILAIVVLPCVFIAGNVYPWWSEWGENF